MDVILKKSAISGIGVFANRNFKKGEIVLNWNPILLTHEQFVGLNDDEKHYVEKVKSRFYLMQSPERFVNHSCEPNTYTSEFSDIALQNIMEGEEITSDYSRDEAPNFYCKCGSKRCKYSNS